MRALPSIEIEILKLPKEYIGNIIYTIIGDPFYDWVAQRVHERNAKIKEENDMNLELDEEVDAVF